MLSQATAHTRQPGTYPGGGGADDGFTHKVARPLAYIGMGNRHPSSQLSMQSIPIYTVLCRPVFNNLIRSDKGRETPMMVDAHYFLYHTA
jgi:hypothetical protein